MPTKRQVLYGLGGLGALGASVFALRPSPLFGSTAIARTAVSFDVPRGACDCHVHIFDPARFPYAAKRVYTPPEALVEDLLELQKNLHLDRVVVVQPSVYGSDNSCALAVVRQLGARARGVVVIDRTTSRTEIDEMAVAGARGIRLNLNTTPSGEIDAEGSKRSLDLAAEQIRDRGWHIQFYTRPHVIAALKSHIEQLPFPVVFDHFGAAQAAKGPNQPGFDALLDLVKSGHAYVKISGCYRISDKAPDFPDATPMAQALIAANPDRVVWGTDWPHPDAAFGQGAACPRSRRHSRSTMASCSTSCRNGWPIPRSGARFWSTTPRGSTTSKSWKEKPLPSRKQWAGLRRVERKLRHKKLCEYVWAKRVIWA